MSNSIRHPRRAVDNQPAPRSAPCTHCVRIAASAARRLQRHQSLEVVACTAQLVRELAQVRSPSRLRWTSLRASRICVVSAIGSAKALMRVELVGVASWFEVETCVLRRTQRQPAHCGRCSEGDRRNDGCRHSGSRGAVPPTPTLPTSWFLLSRAPRLGVHRRPTQSPVTGSNLRPPLPLPPRRAEECSGQEGGRTEDQDSRADPHCHRSRRRRMARGAQAGRSPPRCPTQRNAGAVG